MDLKDIYNSFEDREIESIYYKDIQEITLTNKTFIKNGKIHIRLDEENKVYYTNKENFIKDLKKIFEENTIPINVIVN